MFTHKNCTKNLNIYSMNQVSFYENDIVIISYLPDSQSILCQWKDFPDSAEFRNGMNEMEKAMLKYNTNTILADSRKQGAISPEDQHWALYDWGLEAKEKLGTKQKVAIVVPDDIFAQLSLDAVMSDSAVAETDMSYFPDPDAAEKWLIEQTRSMLKQE